MGIGGHQAGTTLPKVASPGPLPRLAELVRRAAALEPRAFLGEPDERLAQGLVRPLLALGTETLALVALLGATVDDASELAGTCFAVRLELRHALRLLEAEQDRSTTLVSCDIARQGLVRCGQALLADPAGRAGDELARGRAAALVRALYMRLRRLVARADAHTGRRALHLVEAALREASRRPEFSAVRLSDHFVLESVLARLAELAARPHAEPEEMRALVSDARATVDLLAHIGQRPELRAYDRHLVAILSEQLGRAAAGRALLVQGRELLRGRDDALDAVLAEATGHLELPGPLLVRLQAELARVDGELSDAGAPGRV